jgi:hypothetical protein
MDARDRVTVENEALFRHVNEEIEGLNAAFSVVTKDFDIVCECGDRACMERITVLPVEYEAVRSRSDEFFVRPGHVFDDVEDVTSRHEDYWVVRKQAGGPGELARQLDERT